MSIWADIMTVTDLLWPAPNVFTFRRNPLSSFLYSCHPHLSSI